MKLQEIMSYNTFVVVGDTIKDGKYAKEIKEKLISKGYNVFCVHKELKSINDIEEEIDIIDLCINPVLGLNYLKECNKIFKCVLIQPGAESEELINYLKDNDIDYLEGCALVGLSLYKR
ncbi:MAG: CoA-binding protein [Acholeplasmatales bacterium]|nr:CoA-binding protein [Acholeplasmatales bacterium]